MSLSQWCVDFVQYCLAKGLSQHTIRAYEADLRDFTQWMSKINEPLLTPELIVQWMNELRKRELAPSTIRRRLACLKVMWHWLEENNLIEINPFHKRRTTVSVPRTLPRTITQDELKRLIHPGQFGGRHTDFVDLPRETIRLAMEMLLITGIRVSELCSIRLQDIDHSTGTILIQGKGNRQRQVFLVGETAKRSLEAYLELRNKWKILGERLLFTPSGTAAKPEYIRRLLHEHVRAMGLKRRITPHMFRHSAATQLMEQGVDIRFVQKLLGHSSISTTEIYTHVTNASLRKIISDINVIERIL